MNAKSISLFIAVVISVLFSVSLVSAADNFTVSPSSFSQTAVVGDTNSGVFTIENTGVDNYTFTISDTNLQRTGSSIAVNVNDTNLVIEPGTTAEINFSYDTSGAAVGSYNANITVADNITSSEVISLSLALSSATGALLTVDGEEDDVLEMDGDVDERVDESFRFRNSGNVTLTSIQLEVTDLEGPEDDIEENDIDFDEKNFDLEPGESQRVEIEVDIPSGISEGLYEGIITAKTDQGDFTFELELDVDAGNIDVFVRQNDRDVRNGLLEIFGEEGELVNDFEFVVENDGEVNVENLFFTLDGDLEEEFSSATIPASAVTFSPDNLDLDDGEDDTIEVDLQIPSGQQSGDYFADIEVRSNSGEKLDEVTLKVKVVGDIFIESITIPETVTPGDNVDVEVVITNQESQLQRNVKLSGVLFDVDSANSDISETTSTFILDIKERKTQTLRFKIPEDATDGSKTLELRVDSDNGELIEIEEIIIERPDHKLEIESFAVNPAVLICEDDLFTFVRLHNLGRFDEDVRVTAQVKGFPVAAQTGTFELDEDDVTQRNLVLDVSSLDPGTYTVELKAIYSGISESQESLITIAECRDNIGVDIKPIDPDEVLDNLENATNNNETVTLFGQELERVTVYLGTGVVIVGALIVVALFLL